MSRKENHNNQHKNEIFVSRPEEEKYIQLNKILQKAPDNAILRFESGIYQIKETLNINKSISLMGEGMDKTILIGNELDALVNSQGNNEILFENISFLTQGNKPCNVINIAVGTLKVKNCIISEAVMDREQEHGIGICVGGKTEVEIIRSRFEDNQNAGLWIDNNVNARVTKNEFIDNETGFAAVGNTSINIVENDFNRNHIGLVCDGSANGNITKNNFCENRGGILIKGNAKISIENNIFNKNDAALGLAEYCVVNFEENDVKQGGLSLVLRHNAKALIKNNQIENNDQGILSTDESNTEIVENTILHQEKFGILIQDESTTHISANVINENTAGIKFEGHSVFTAEKNQITLNAYGVLATAYAKGTINKNIIEKNNLHPFGWNVEVRENARVDFDNYKEPLPQGIPVNYSKYGNQFVVSPPSDSKKVSFSELISQIKSGQEILIEDGEYHLSAPIIIDKSVRISSKSPSKVVISGEGLTNLFIYKASGELILSGIHFSLDTSEQSNVIMIHSGKLNMDQCIIEGARDNQANKRDFGAGLLLSSNSVAAISNSIFKLNLIGISVQDVASVTLRSNQFTDNFGYGIIFRDQSKGILKGNEYHLNKAYGLMAYEESELEINSDKCHNNRAGFGFMHKAKATILDSESFEHEYHGFFIDNDACCVLRKNRSYANQMSGIAIFGDNQSEVAENEIFQNEDSGIECAEDAQPIIKANNIHKNTDGIYLGDNAHSKITNNIIHENDVGIRILDEASADIFQNKIYQNSEGGIIDFSNSESNLGENEEFENGDPSSLIFMEDEDEEDQLNLGDFFAHMLGSENLSDDPNVAAIPLPGNIQDLEDEEEEEQSESPTYHEFQIFYFEDGKVYGEFLQIEIGPETTQEWIKKEENRMIEEFKQEHPDAEIF